MLESLPRGCSGQSMENVCARALSGVGSCEAAGLALTFILTKLL